MISGGWEFLFRDLGGFIPILFFVVYNMVEEFLMQGLIGVFLSLAIFILEVGL
jgi:VIT1/CCC1 family predicted Fe2+/Mn2+ transporter